MPNVLELFKSSGALLEGHFKLTSGKHSDVYYEKFTILKQPRICEQVCVEMAKLFENDKVELVVGPTTGGIIIAYEVAKYLGLNSIYAEADPGGKGRVFKRGFHIDEGTRVLIVDDVLTTGGSIFEVIELVKSYKAEIVGIGEFLDRSGGKVKFDYPFKALATVDANAWEPENCPLCKKDIPITQRGSRKFQTA
ncbi:MAG: orotate phosphoribosyltransferase [candidate division Zixibacteria bacterium]|nr:orotate phosphoribosyltransferase [candidate division Zixibacteria bacterium]